MKHKLLILLVIVDHPCPCPLLASKNLCNWQLCELTSQRHEICTVMQIVVTTRNTCVAMPLRLPGANNFVMVFGFGVKVHLMTMSMCWSATKLLSESTWRGMTMLDSGILLANALHLALSLVYRERLHRVVKLWISWRSMAAGVPRRCHVDDWSQHLFWYDQKPMPMKQKLVDVYWFCLNLIVLDILGAQVPVRSAALTIALSALESLVTVLCGQTVPGGLDNWEQISTKMLTLKWF